MDNLRMAANVTFRYQSRAESKTRDVGHYTNRTKMTRIEQITRLVFARSCYQRSP